MTRATHEPSDAPPRVAVIGLSVLAGGLVLTLLAVAALVMVFTRTEPPLSPVVPQRPPAPRLELAGGAALAEVQTRGARKLDGHDQVDRGPGPAHIPIDRAMQITARRGWADAEPAS
jgi:hypothetical protein